MSKKRNKKKKRNYLSEWDNQFLQENNFFYTNPNSLFIISSCSAKDVHKAAEEIFGKSHYIDFSSTS